MVGSTEAILAVIASEVDIDPAALRPDATLEQLEIDSLDVASALFALEDAFDIEIDPDNITLSSTISEFVEHVSRLSSK